MNIYLIVLAVIILLVIRVNRSRIKGSWGEYKVARQLKKLNPEEYKVINRLLFRTEDRSSQIDHVVVSRFGIYVIETKNFKGWIVCWKSSIKECIFFNACNLSKEFVQYYSAQ